MSIKDSVANHFREVTIFFVDDGSNDDTEYVIEKLIFDEKLGIKIQYIKLIKNHGKELAVKCGIDHSASDYCVIMDGDLQHPPESIVDALKKSVSTNAKVICILPKKRDVRLYQIIGTYIYKKILEHLSKEKIFFTDFIFMQNSAVNIIKLYNESDFYTRGILSLIGYKIEEVFYEPQKRKHGTSKFSFIKLYNLAINGVISVSTKPLRMAIYFGLCISTLSILFGFYLVIEKLALGQPIPGFATLGAGLFFLGGIQLLFLGIIGEYIGKTFIQAKNRPLYTVEYKKSKF
jgi:glycosyltransferase involved in cell wall biosynthesis